QRDRYAGEARRPRLLSLWEPLRGPQVPSDPRSMRSSGAAATQPADTDLKCCRRVARGNLPGGSPRVSRRRVVPRVSHAVAVGGINVLRALPIPDATVASSRS